MTWNVWRRFGAWRERERAIVDTLTGVQADLLALQETWRTSATAQADVLGTELGLHAAYAATRMPMDTDPDVELGVAVLSTWHSRDCTQPTDSQCRQTTTRWLSTWHEPESGGAPQRAR